LAKPLKILSRDLELVSKFELSDSPNAGSAFREIAVMIDSSQRMKAALRSFGRYVPIEVVRELLAQKQDAIRGGKLRELTLFFPTSPISLRSAKTLARLKWSTN
jgi:adenylate cyclase